jgi:hypothetical protein
MNEPRSTPPVTSKAKRILSSIAGFVIVVAAIALGRYLGSEGVSSVIKSSNQNQTQERVTNYFTDTSSWKAFTSPIGRFAASFPSYPKSETQMLNIPGVGAPVKSDRYSSVTADGTEYFIDTATYPPEVDTSNPEKNLEGGLNGEIASTAGNKLVSSCIFQLDEHW